MTGSTDADTIDAVRIRAAGVRPRHLFTPDHHLEHLTACGRDDVVDDSDLEETLALVTCRACLRTLKFRIRNEHDCGPDRRRQCTWPWLAARLGDRWGARCV